ncbi:MAG: hypothetical protein JWO62_3637 [Acidimicrobiaceae bacterium]|nr:hypothetical protein [Acidimicrobiaceae bacterium]
MTFASLLAGYTRGDIVASVLFAFVFATLGYRMSHRHRLARGVTPWRLPSAVWALICFFLQPFGIIVELLAQATTKPAVGAGAAPAMPGSFPAYPQRAGTSVPQPAVVEEPAANSIAPPLPVHTGPPPPIGDHTGKTPLFGWYTDTTGRHEQRYWDGRGWSDNVRDQGVAGIDPV